LTPSTVIDLIYDLAAQGDMRAIAIEFEDPNFEITSR
jgi:hypothetical protein